MSGKQPKEYLVVGGPYGWINELKQTMACSKPLRLLELVSDINLTADELDQVTELNVGDRLALRSPDDSEESPVTHVERIQ